MLVCHEGEHDLHKNPVHEENRGGRTLRELLTAASRHDCRTFFISLFVCLFVKKQKKLGKLVFFHHQVTARNTTCWARLGPRKQISCSNGPKSVALLLLPEDGSRDYFRNSLFFQPIGKSPVCESG
jgi:hypothetical protein